MNDKDAINAVEFLDSSFESNDIIGSGNTTKRRQRRRTLAIHNGTNLLSSNSAISLRRSQRQRRPSKKYGSPPPKRCYLKSKIPCQSSREISVGNSSTSESQRSTFSDAYCDKITLTTQSRTPPSIPSSSSSSDSDVQISSHFMQQVYVRKAHSNQNILPSNDYQVQPLKNEKENMSNLLVPNQVTSQPSVENKEISFNTLRGSIIDHFGQSSWEKVCFRHLSVDYSYLDVSHNFYGYL